MAEEVRFFFDQHLPYAVADGLRRRGVDVLTVQEAGRCGLLDSQQLELRKSGDTTLILLEQCGDTFERMG